MNDYYVYVYIDPRNYEEFYFGKGRGSRKEAHLLDQDDTEKARRIEEIRKAGLKPIVRVIAKGLSQHDALLVEKTLLWKLGKRLTNISSGHYSENFRPHNTMHLSLSGFDFKNGFYYYNVDEGSARNWDDYCKYGIISAGGRGRDGKTQWKDAISGFKKGDIFAAYWKYKKDSEIPKLNKLRGFVGIGKIVDEAKPIKNILIKEKPLLSLELKAPAMDRDFDSDEFCEYVCKVEWLRKVKREEAKWKSKKGLYTTTHVRASLDNQPDTIKFLEESFGIKVQEYLI